MQLRRPSCAPVPRFPTEDLETAVVGAGPAGLAVALHLALTDPGAVDPGRFAVVDPSGCWLDIWRRQLAAQRITHLRSPAVHHPHPDPFALLRSLDHDSDLTRPDGLLLPSADALGRFCADLVRDHGLDRALLAEEVTAATLDRDHLVVGLASGRYLRCRRVVVATNPRRPVLPPWAGLVPRGRLHIGGRLEAPDLGVRRVVVVGGGMSAAHLALGAVDEGAAVTLVARRPLVQRRMDVDPTWLGPLRMGPFAVAPPRRRRQIVDEARGGGSMPAWAVRRLRSLAGTGGLRLLVDDEVVAVEETETSLVLRTARGCLLPADEVWTATGARVDVARDPVLADVAGQHPVPVHDGMPALGEDLRWGAAPVWVVGAPAALQLGPVAGNLYGHRAGAARVAAALTGQDVTQGTRW